MEMFLALALIWMIVTVVGHGSFLVIQVLFGQLFGSHRSNHSEAQSGSSDLPAARRVIMKLSDRQMLNPGQVADLLRLLHELDQVEQSIPLATKSSVRTDAAAEVAAKPHRSATDEASQSRRKSAPIEATLVEREPGASLPAAAGPAPQPTLSRSEIVRSFLAAHNIQWGELVAGTLIVVCSIGLVVSLWNTISSHRIVPSLMFLAANATIYAAGFYTLSRWRLRHTSRAVLAIATLLVPLGVVAGIAAAETGPQAVLLSEGLTIGTIVVAALLYGMLLYRGGRALARRPYAPPLALSVAGPVAVIPLIPASIRSFDSAAGWVVAAASLLVTLAISWTLWLRGGRRSACGVAAGRVQILVLLFSAFATAVLVGYVGFALRDFGRPAWMAIAVSILPAFVGLAAGGRALARDARIGTQAMFGATICALSIGWIAMLSIPAMASQSWLWSWGIVSSASFAVGAWLFRQPGSLAISTVPIGLSATISAPCWLGGQAWSDLRFTDPFIAGESMLVAMLIALVTSGAGLLNSVFARRTALRSEPRTVTYRSLATLRIAAAAWLALAAAIAAVLAVAPHRDLGIAPWWSVTGVLGYTAIAVATTAVRGASSQRRYWTGGTILVLGCAASSMFPSLDWRDLMETVALGDLVHMLLTVAASLLAICEFLPLAISRLSGSNNQAQPTYRAWNRVACVSVCFGSAVACGIAPTDWEFATQALLCGAALLVWASTLTGSHLAVLTSQLVAVSAAIVFGIGYFDDWLASRQAWSDGTAVFGWILVGAVVVLLWTVIRRIVTTRAWRLHPRLQSLNLGHLSFVQTPIGWTAVTMVLLLVVGAGWTFLSLLSLNLDGPAIACHEHAALPVLALLAVGTTLWVLRRSESSETGGIGMLDDLIAWTWVSLAVWMASHVSHSLSVSAPLQLIVATSIASTVLVLSFHSVAQRLIPGSNKFRSGTSVVVPLLITSASIVLLLQYWYRPLLDQTGPSRLVTVTVAAWWLIGAVVFFLNGLQERNGARSLCSALLAPAAAIVATPLLTTAGPVSWIQVGALVAMAWYLTAYLLMTRSQLNSAHVAIKGSLWLATTIGIGSALAAAARIVFDQTFWNPAMGVPGFVVSLVVVGFWSLWGLRSHSGLDAERHKFGWPVGLTLLGGQFGWLGYATGMFSGIAVVELVAATWLLASLASLIRFDRLPRTGLHVAASSLLLLLVDYLAGMQSQLTPWFAIAGLIAGGVLVGVAARKSERGQLTRWSLRCFGWIVVLAGAMLLAYRVGLSPVVEVGWTVTVAWTAIWVAVWRLLAPDGPTGKTSIHRPRWRGAPDAELAILLGFGAFGEACLLTAAGAIDGWSRLVDPLPWVRVAAFAGVAATVIGRLNRPVAWITAAITMLSAIALSSVPLAVAAGATQAQRFAAALLPSGLLIALLSHWVAPAARAVAQRRGGSARQLATRMTDCIWQSVCLIATLSGCVSGWMIVSGCDPSSIHLTISVIALSAWATAAVAETSGRESLRHAAVTMALVTIGLWASVNHNPTNHLLLTATMRWLVAAVLVIPMLLFVVPQVLGPAVSQRWRPALQWGVVAAVVAAGFSLVAMLALEIMVRAAAGIADIPLPSVIGVALTLAILSGVAGVLAILSGPHSGWRDTLPMTDQQRTWLVVAAQALGLTTWLHIFLCQPDWAFIGLRGHWPYVVMAISFVSVGATEWARRWGDRVLAKTLQQTALYLPLIPVVGFWFGSFDQSFDWLFDQGRVRYDVLLAIGAAYYLAISTIWKQSFTRIAAVILGNAAWWVVLADRPDWRLVAHPQLWLIPPAACVLVTLHRYRSLVKPAVAESIRYAATLVIYIASTADMLIQQVGEHIQGPIILVSLALVGMLAGVVLRVRAFLYLGAMFVFVGVASMVWHATESIGQVWPWWVFGITTGIGLLAGLMTIEKNKPKLQHYANKLASWQR